MRIDSHQHFWHYEPAQYAWIDERMGVLRHDFLPSDLEPELDALGMAGSIAVQARQDLEETRWLLDLASRHPRVLGVVGWVDLCSDGLASTLDELTETPFLKGVRHVLQDEKDDTLMLSEPFRRGIGQLLGYGLAYDILIYPRHLKGAIKLVDGFPAQPFVLDHLAKPHIKSGELGEWEEDLRELAARPNVHCKVSGMVTEADWREWHPADFVPYMDVALEAFGEDRVMFGSDWPVCTLAGDYRAVMEVVADYAAKLSDSARAKLFGLNAAMFYRVA